jgi:hypothetical protein
MSLIELILTLQTNDFAVADAQTMKSAITTMQQCEQSTEYHPGCAGVVEKINHLKNTFGGPYVDFQ